MNKTILRNERGGAHILIFALLAMIAMVTIVVTAFNVTVQYAKKDKTKIALDAATHAAALDIDEVQASYGNIVWDPVKGTESFYTYLRKNLRLDASNQPMLGSYVKEPPIIHFLGQVTNPTYPFEYVKSVTVYAGTSKETTRTIHTTIYGPSVVAIMEVRQYMYGESDEEPIILSSVSSIRRRY